MTDSPSEGHARVLPGERRVDGFDLPTFLIPDVFFKPCLGLLLTGGYADRNTLTML